LRALGASKGLLLGALWIEFSVLGLFAGCLAIVGAEAASWALQTRALDLNYAPTLLLWPIGLAAGVLIISCVGVFSCRSAVSTPPLVVLREV
jgi:putative ABC transport system permease protein